MKCLIVDDEESIRQSIRMMGRWAEYGIDEVLEAENGQRALQLITGKTIDIVITDMKMDTMDGVTLLKHLEKMAQPPHVLVISGYSDYPFMHSAISAGAVDYILKPLSIDRFNEGLLLAVQKRRREYGSPTDTPGINRKGSIHNALSNELAAYPAVKEFVEQHTQYQLFGFHVLNFAQVCKDVFTGIPNLLYYTLQCAMEEKAAGRFDLLMVRLLGGNVGSMMGFAVFPNKSAQPAQETLGVMLSEISKQYGVRFVLSISECAEGFDGIADALYQVNHGLYATDLTGDKWVYCQAGEDAARLNPIREAYEPLRAALLSGDLDEALSIIDRQLSLLHRPGALTLRNLRKAFTELSSIVSEQLTARGLSEGIPEEMDLRKFEETLLQHAGDQPACLNVFRTYLSPYCNMLGSSHTNSLIRRMCDYVDAHYAEKLNLNTLSEQFFISREYASRIFKKEIGTTFINYLTDVRLKHAGQLLIHTDLSVSTIADHTGFKESGYLIRVFRKKYGLTPKEYREKNGGS